MQEIADLRKEYSKASLDIADVHHDPMMQFEKWFNEALSAQVMEPNAMNLATVSESGKPTSRIVLLKGVENSQFVFFTNYQSRKGEELLENPKAALCFYWHDLERQVRIEGSVSIVSPEESDAYFHSRPRDSRIGAWASPQSKTLADRQALEALVLAQYDRFNTQPLDRPEHWGGYRLFPHSIEFWQGRPSRLHDRIRYQQQGDAWKIERLAP